MMKYFPDWLTIFFMIGEYWICHPSYGVIHFAESKVMGKSDSHNAESLNSICHEKRRSQLIPLNESTGWSSVHWNATECPWLTQCTLEYHWATERILAGCTGTPLEKLNWNSPTLKCHWRNLVESAPHWDATGETLTFAAYTGTPLEGLWQPTHAPTHIVKHAE